MPRRRPNLYEQSVNIGDCIKERSYAFHRDGEPCLVAMSTANCPENHLYGRTFEDAI